MAHNSSTVERDLDMFVTVLQGRLSRPGVTATQAAEIRRDIDQVQAAKDHVQHAYAGLMGLFGITVAREVMDPDGHVHDHDHGAERSLVDQAHRDEELARRFETR